MTAITFDTLKFAKRLKAAGIPDNQAEVWSEIQREIMQDTLEHFTENTADIRRLEKKIDHLDHKIGGVEYRLKAEIKLLRWMVGAVMGGIGALILKAFFPM